MRKFFVGGNWKANPKTCDEAEQIITTFNEAKTTAQAEVVIAAPFVFLPLLQQKLRKDWQASAENAFDKPNGAFTGEVTIPMIQSMGVNWTILGHSERRDIFEETDEILASKATFALDNKMKIIYCCGEHAEERENGKHKEFVSSQIEALCNAVKEEQWANVVIAYEPIWAIGTGKVASKEDAQEMCKYIRTLIASKVNQNVADKVRILYGGSVKPDNSQELAAMDDIDGFLVGGASLTAGFIQIVNSIDTPENSKCCLLI